MKNFGFAILPKVMRRDKPSGRSRRVCGSKAALASPKVLIPIRAWQYLHGSTSVASRLAPSLPAFMRNGEQDFYEHWGEQVGEANAYLPFR